jgi:hypothetical protein
MSDPIVIKDPTLFLGGTDWSDGCKEVTLKLDFDKSETTHGRSGGAKESVCGLVGGSVSMKFLANKDRGARDTFFWNNRGAKVSFRCNHRNAGPSDEVPHFTGFVNITSFVAIAGGVGDLEMHEYTFETTGVVNRVTA